MIKKLSIKNKMRLLIISLLGSVSIFIFLYFPYSVKENGLKNIEAKAESVNRLLSGTICKSISKFDSCKISQIAYCCKSDKDLSYVILTNKSGIVYSYNKDIASNLQYSILSSKADIDAPNEIYKTKCNLTDNNKLVGVIYTGYSLSNVQSEVNKTKGIVAIISIIIFGFGGIIFYYFSLIYFKPMQNIISTAKTISAGNWQVRAVESDNEIGTLAKSFNKMIDNIETANKEMEYLNKNLEKTVNKRTNELLEEIEHHKDTASLLVIAKEKAEEMNKLKSNFLANMSHELRTPLNGILGFSEIMTEFDHTPEIKEMAIRIHESGKRLLTTLNSILDLSIIESKKLKLNKETFNIAEETQRNLTAFYPMAEKKNIYLKLLPVKNDMVCNLDKQLYFQILNNLLHNAIKFTIDGGVTVILDSVVEGENKFAIVRVMDTGIGIPEKYHDIIFDEFRQVSEGLSRHFEG
ncbi:MAG: histidine kinase dimerization/phospho-acceptor domain-containing protein, partial [Bacteroidota bacterium]|nr:histidine kinase dimerization/phospho-acceptor domain-containing protein [Bacteroidota bacterium]